jgi:hypothetical protein
MLLRTAILFLLAMPLPALSQLHSLTLGIDVNSPYGLSEPWFTIRGALARCPDFESVAEQADRRTATAEAIPKNGIIPDFERIEKAVIESGGGARLRAIEATIEGDLISKDGTWNLQIRNKHFPLQTFTESVQQERKKPKPPTDEESSAYKRLVEQAVPGRRMRVIGPLRYKTNTILEVRLFEAVKPNPSQGKS